jgi:hypothetical protein
MQAADELSLSWCPGRVHAAKKTPRHCRAIDQVFRVNAFQMSPCVLIAVQAGRPDEVKSVYREHITMIHFEIAGLIDVKKAGYSMSALVFTVTGCRPVRNRNRNGEQSSGLSRLRDRLSVLSYIHQSKTVRECLHRISEIDHDHGNREIPS